MRLLLQRSCSPKDKCPLGSLYMESQCCGFKVTWRLCSEGAGSDSFLFSDLSVEVPQSTIMYASTWAKCVRDRDVAAICLGNHKGVTRALQSRLTNRHLFLQPQNVSCTCWYVMKANYSTNATWWNMEPVIKNQIPLRIILNCKN